MVIELIPVYKYYGDVPLYLYPNIDELRRRIVEKYGSIKHAKRHIREELRCFLSENAIWKKFVRTDVEDYAEPPVEPKLYLAVVMVRGTKENFNYIDYLRSRGLPINPYSYASSYGNSGKCFGFYCSNFSIIDEVLSELAEKKLVDSAMIVNSVWYARLGKPVNLNKLVESGFFVPSTSRAFKLVTGVLGTSKVFVFHTGTVRIMRALTPEQAKSVLGKVYALMARYGAIQ